MVEVITVTLGQNYLFEMEKQINANETTRLLQHSARIVKRTENLATETHEEITRQEERLDDATFHVNNIIIILKTSYFNNLY
jgi:hypothetical protein